MTILGFSQYDVQKLDAEEIKLTSEFAAKEKTSNWLVGLYFDPNNPERQEIMSVRPNMVQPVRNLSLIKTEEAA
jgi:hypothetical protein